MAKGNIRSLAAVKVAKAASDASRRAKSTGSQEASRAASSSSRLSRKKRLVLGVVLFAFIVGSLAPLAAQATYISDPNLIALKQRVIAAATAGDGAAGALAQSERDIQAKQAADCQAVEDNARQSAINSVTRHMPPDPSKFTQNTTCLVDVATVQIPVVLTGIGFIDAIISGAIQRFMTGTCQKATGFLSDLQGSALNQLNSSTGGTANLLLSSTR